MRSESGAIPFSSEDLRHIRALKLTPRSCGNSQNNGSPLPALAALRTAFEFIGERRQALNSGGAIRNAPVEWPDAKVGEHARFRYPFLIIGSAPVTGVK